MNKTPLCSVHEALGARMIDFGGWYMPVQYTSIIEEHETVRIKAGLFDLFHMGEFWLSGPDAMANIQRIVCQDVEFISDRQIVYTPMCRPDGSIVDDLLVYRWNPEKFLLVVNAANMDKDLVWISSQLSGDVQFEDHSNITGLIAIQGPDGFELYFPADKCAEMWDALLEAGKPYGIKPIGLGARDTLRLEARLMLYGNDIHDGTTPIEANLDWTVKLGKGAFNGSDVIRKQKEKGTEKTLVGFEMGKGPAPRHGYPVLHKGKKVGEVTSGTMSPTMKKNIGLAYVPPSLKEIGSKFDIEVRGKPVPATVISTPFYVRPKA
ncbi:MAG: Aminomethyltransferase [bacterium ADurb.Bin374]|nr:MAG: Aminomethyltransferase [bacterium ADurb.Bin374]